MDIFTINNQQFITLPNAALSLEISKQALHRIINSWSITTIKISGNLLAISLSDFERIKNGRNLKYRPNKYKK